MKNSLQKGLILLSLVVILMGCTAQKLKKTFSQYETNESYFKGFVLFDPGKDKTIVNHHGAKYFTPASNTKLFTFYATFKTFQDSVQSLAYFQATDSLIIRGTADPSFWYGFENDKTNAFLSNAKDTIYVLDANIEDSVYGAGWAWDDFDTYYMPEKSLFPIHSNLVRINKQGHTLESEPQYFSKSITEKDSLNFKREQERNAFYIKKVDSIETDVPFRTSNELLVELLKEYLGKEAVLIPDKPYPFSYVYGLSYDDLLHQMMVVSDNFIAEQLMLQVAYATTGQYKVKNGIDYSLDKYMSDIPQKPRWVDGSGLSRYNLFTPEDMVYLLKKMYHEIPLNTLLGYFPVGGQTGTLKNWYAIEGEPFIYAKSGTLSNNYNLSGYLRAKSGKILIFSYMNNHYAKSTSAIKKEMENTLKMIYYAY